jgi:hypothetical protein
MARILDNTSLDVVKRSPPTGVILAQVRPRGKLKFCAPSPKEIFFQYLNENYSIFTLYIKYYLLLARDKMHFLKTTSLRIACLK